MTHMKGLWEALPASPCSAASDDTTARPSRQNKCKGTNIAEVMHVVSASHTSPASVDLSRDALPVPASKRQRVELTRNNVPVTIEFVEAKESPSNSSSHLVTKLNCLADDERRKALLQRLRAIDEEKAMLSRSSTSLDNEVVVVVDKRAPTKPPRAPRKRKVTPAKKRSARTRVVPAKSPALSVPPVIDIDNDVNIPPGLTKGKVAKKPTPAVTKRVSSRVRRPRSQCFEANAVQGKPAPLPSCMSKCKRFQFCKRLITTMLRNPSTAPFSAPVNELWRPEAIPRYFDVVTHPMDLRTVKKNLETVLYVNPIKGDLLPYRFNVERFSDDVRLIFRNAMVYNRKGDMLYNCANSLKEDFDKTIREELPNLPSPEEVSASLSKKRSSGRNSRKERGNDVGKRRNARETSEVVANSVDEMTDVMPRATKVSTDVSVGTLEEYDYSELDCMSEKELRNRLQYVDECRVPVLSRTPVPKGAGYLTRAALLYDVEMTWEEKTHCSSCFDKIPRNKVDAMIAMIRKCPGHVDNEETGEFEFDMDRLDNVAMRNIEAFLEQFVPGFKTVRSSSLGREFGSVDEIEAEVKAINERLAKEAKESKATKKDSVRVATKPKSFFGDCKDAYCSSSDSSSGEDSDSDLSSDSSDDSDCE